MEVHNPLVDNPNRTAAEHQAMFDNFVRISAIGCFHIAATVVSLAIGGVEGHWYWAAFWFFVATGAAIYGAVSELEWRPGAVVLALAVITLALLG